MDGLAVDLEHIAEPHPAEIGGLGYGDNEWKMAEDAGAALLEMAGAAGLTIRQRSMSAPGAYVHELGGARMGADPRTSVLSPFNQCWDANNLFVVDGSSFPTAGWQNPTLTMMALAVRAAGPSWRRPGGERYELTLLAREPKLSGSSRRPGHTGRGWLTDRVS